MKKPLKDKGAPLQEYRERGLEELGPAVRDVAHRLIHDLSDTPEDIRDAVAFAPLAAVKVLQACANAISRHPRRTMLALAGLAAAAIGALALARGKGD